jgi:hypothetical protein
LTTSQSRRGLLYIGSDSAADRALGPVIVFTRRLAARFALAAANDQNSQKEPRNYPEHRLNHCSTHRLVLLLSSIGLLLVVCIRV